MIVDRIPILKLGDVLLVSIQVDLDDTTALRLEEDLAARIADTSAHGVIIDITALEIVDSFIGRMLSTIAGVSRVLDARTVVAGMRPAVAITLVELGLSLAGIQTALDLESGLELLGRGLRATSDAAWGSDLFATYDGSDTDLDAVPAMLAVDRLSSVSTPLAEPT